MVPQSFGAHLQGESSPCCVVWLSDSEQFILEVYDTFADPYEESVTPGKVG